MIKVQTLPLNNISIDKQVNEEVRLRFMQRNMYKIIRNISSFYKNGSYKHKRKLLRFLHTNILLYNCYTLFKRVQHVDVRYPSLCHVSSERI